MHRLLPLGQLNKVIGVQMPKSNFAKEGKNSAQRRTKNAVVHGIYAEDILLPWESREEFERLSTDLVAEFRPHGRMEEETVSDIARLRWQKRRLQQMLAAATYGDPFVIDLIEARQESWAGIRSHLKWKAKNERELSEVLNGVFLEQITESAETLAERLRGGKLSRSKVENAQRMQTVLEEFTIPLIKKFEDRPNAEESLRRTYSPEYLERIVRLEAMIDARVDKALARLVGLMEYKRLAAPYENPRLLCPDQSTREEVARD
jgi:hypothetical protein